MKKLIISLVGILLLILLMMNGRAALIYQVENSNTSSTDTQSSSAKEGWFIQVKNYAGICTAFNITKLIKYPACTASYCRVWTGTGVDQLSVSSTMSGDNCSINYPMNSTAKYFVDFDANGGTYTDAYVNIPGFFPHDMQYITALTQSNPNWNIPPTANTSDYIQCLKAIEVVCDAKISGEPVYFKITAKDSLNASSLTIFNATVNGTIYTTSGGTITTDILQNDTGTYNATIYSENYIPYTLTNSAVSSDIQVTLTPIGLYSFSYSNYTLFLGTNYTRSLVYSYNYTCQDGSTTVLERYVLNVLNSSLALSCDNTTKTETAAFRYSREQYYNISFIFDTSIGVSRTVSKNLTFASDLNNPTVYNLSLKFTSDFGIPEANISLTCRDNMYPELTYNITLNGGIIYYSNNSNNTYQFNSSTNIINGVNVLKGQCNDTFGKSAVTTISQNIEIRKLYIIDEQLNTGFQVTNISSVVVYLDDNRTKYDFRANNKNNISFVATRDVKLRFELIYSGGTLVLRYVDIGLLQNDIRVCANREGITHYEQIITSSSIKPIIMKSVYSDCVVAADYTRFAYQDAKILKAYTYNNLYYLYTFDDDGNQAFLSAVDGSIAAYINIDTLEFQATAYNMEVLGDGLSYEKVTDEQLKISYFNMGENNTAVNIYILRLDTNATIFNTSSVTNPNKFILYYDYSSLAGYTNSTPFQLTVIATRPSGVKVITKYFNFSAQSTKLPAGLAIVMSILFIVFGLSMASSDSIFGFFGILICIVAIAVLTMTPSTWITLFFMFTEIILLIFIILTTTVRTPRSMA